MTFVQIIDYRSEEPDGGESLADEWEQSTEGRRTARRAITGRDRNDPKHYMTIVFFDDYESAMANNELPETQDLAEKMQSVVTGPPAFHDLDVIADRS
jgi:hypothetical protein